MSQGSAEGQGGANDILLIVVAVIVLCMLLSWLFKDYFIYGALWVAWFKAWVSNFVVPDPLLPKIMAGISNVDITTVGYGDAFEIVNRAGRYFAWPIGAFMAFVGFKVMVRSTVDRYRRTFTLYSLLAQKAKHFPAVRPIVGLNLLGQPLHKGPWAAAKSAIRLSLEQKLLYIVPPGLPDVPANRKGIRHIEPRKIDREKVDTFRLNRERTTQLMAHQLGFRLLNNGIIQLKRWRSWPKHYQALIAVFLLRAAPLDGDARVQSDELLIQYNDSFYTPNLKKGKRKQDIKLDDLDIEGVEDVLKRYLDNPSVLREEHRLIYRLLGQHAYINPLMMNLLGTIGTGARARGILTTADFIWLRPIDRTLWYCLNNMGRKTAWPECGGAWAHMQAEEMMRTPIGTPEVERAVDALEDDLIKEGWLLFEHTPRGEVDARRKSARKSRESASSAGKGRVHR